MSKTSAENSILATAKAYLKPYAASATAFAYSWRNDPFRRTEVTIIGLLLLFAIAIIALVAISFGILYREVVESLIAGLVQSVAMHTMMPSADSIATDLEYLKSRDLVIVATLVLISTTIFSFLIARLALSPTKNALAAQKQFIGNVAHELRTPLSIIRTNAEVALFDAGPGAAIRVSLESMLEEIDRMSNIINNLLSLSTLTRGGGLPMSNVDLGTVVDEAVRHLEPLALKKQIPIGVSKSEYRLVWGNTSALEQVVMNILKNALTYSAPASPVSLSIRPDAAGGIELVVEDQGAGIPEKDLHRVLEPFYRGDESRTRGKGGSGLGLAIVNELLRIHEGRMMIRSAPGRGTAISITLPQGKSTGEAPGAADTGYGRIAVDFSRR